MLTVRLGHERGYADHGWLKSFHTFSFAGYHDPAHMGFRGLRVINEDRVEPGRGFGTHAHDNMEIVSYVLEGQLEHEDSMGNGAVLTPGEFQRITAGTGITHSEFNPSPNELVHFYQIWIKPTERGLPPSYEQKSFSEESMVGRWCLVASPDEDDALAIHADARIYLSQLEPAATLDLPIPGGRHGWLQVLRGEITVDDVQLAAGDAIAMTGEDRASIQASSSAKLMLFDLL